MARKTKKSKNKKKSGMPVFILIFLLTTFVFSLLRLSADDGSGAGGTVIFSTGEHDERLSRDMTPIAVEEGSPFYAAFANQDRVNVLVMGINQGMTDTIMLGSYDIENQKVSIISIPRDTYYARPDNKSAGYYKINSIYHRKNSAVDVAEAVSDILYGMPIHFYAIVEFDDIRKIMDAIGGVEINIPFHYKYSDSTPGYELYIDIPKGLQTITSKNVEQFLRFRKGDPGYPGFSGGDIQRQEIQREFVVKVISKCLQLQNIGDVAKIALENIDSDLDYATAIKVAAKAVTGLKSENITTYLLPGNAQYIEIKGENLSFWVRDAEDVYNLVSEIYNIN